MVDPNLFKQMMIAAKKAEEKRFVDGPPVPCGKKSCPDYSFLCMTGCRIPTREGMDPYRRDCLDYMPDIDAFVEACGG